MHPMGFFSFAPAFCVHVPPPQERCSTSSQRFFDVGRKAFQDGSHPFSICWSNRLRRPPFARCACFPEPVAGSHPPRTADTKVRNRPTVTSYRSSRNELTVLGKSVMFWMK